MGFLFANDASSTLQGAITTSSTSITIATGDAGLFPAVSGGNFFHVTVVDSGGNMEIMRCTARSGGALTVTRGQEGTAAYAFAAGAIVDLRLTKATMEAMTQVTGESIPTIPMANISGLAASGVAFTPTGTIAATNVQAALAELSSEKPQNDGTGATGNWSITAQYLSASAQQQVISGKTASLNNALSDATNNGSFVAASTGTGDANLAGMTFFAGSGFAVKLGVRADGIFSLGGWSAAPHRWYVNCTNGDMVAAGNVTAYSDERLKKDWRDLPHGFVASLAQVHMGTYTRKDTGERQVGVGAQSLQEILPEAVQTGSDGDTLTLAYGNAALAAAVALARELVALRYRIEELERRATP